MVNERMIIQPTRLQGIYEEEKSLLKKVLKGVFIMTLLNYANNYNQLKLKEKQKWFSVQLACNICTKDYK